MTEIAEWDSLVDYERLLRTPEYQALTAWDDAERARRGL